MAPSEVLSSLLDVNGPCGASSFVPFNNVVILQQSAATELIFKSAQSDAALSLSLSHSFTILRNIDARDRDEIFAIATSMRFVYTYVCMYGMERERERDNTV